MSDYTYEQMAKMIDHSLVNQTLTVEELEDGCLLAADYGTASVSIMPWYLKRAADLLRGSGVHAGTTIGFPHGSHTTVIKAAEARHALAEGAEELDMVCNISALRSGKWDLVRDDIAAVAYEAHDRGALIKVIFENCYLTNEEKIRLCEVCGDIPVDFVKTSTGYAAGGCTWEDLALMRAHTPPHVGVKAAGGIRDLDGLLKVRALGGARCGATRTRAMLDDCRQRLGLEPITSGARFAYPAGY